MHSGSKFWAWVSFQTTVLKSWKFQENRRRRVKVLPLLALRRLYVLYKAYDLTYRHQAWCSLLLRNKQHQARWQLQRSEVTHPYFRGFTSHNKIKEVELRWNSRCKSVTFETENVAVFWSIFVCLNSGAAKETEYHVAEPRCFPKYSTRKRRLAAIPSAFSHDSLLFNSSSVLAEVSQTSKPFVLSSLVPQKQACIFYNF